MAGSTSHLVAFRDGPWFAVPMERVTALVSAHDRAGDSLLPDFCEGYIRRGKDVIPLIQLSRFYRMKTEALDEPLAVVLTKVSEDLTIGFLGWNPSTMEVPTADVDRVIQWGAQLVQLVDVLGLLGNENRDRLETWARAKKAIVRLGRLNEALEEPPPPTEPATETVMGVRVAEALLCFPTGLIKESFRRNEVEWVPIPLQKNPWVSSRGVLYRFFDLAAHFGFEPVAPDEEAILLAVDGELRFALGVGPLLGTSLVRESLVQPRRAFKVDIHPALLRRAIETPWGVAGELDLAELWRDERIALKTQLKQLFQSP